ncbi:MAG: Ppx/GppA phosphatase family protein [Actinomycetota bacterium]|nr:Ppx/GppA phosphatase family protein [Actinomycetota bacterium]
MNFASIDIGTNSIRLLIAELGSLGRLRPLLRKAVITRLGEGVNQNGFINQAAMDRTLKVLFDYKELLKKYSTSRVKVAATSAVRDARNARDFLMQIRRKIGFDVDILTGRHEAELTFLGATHILRQPPIRAPVWATFDHRPIVIIDIGGGSTELILGRLEKTQKISEIFSLDIGCVRLTEMFLRSDPPLDREVKALQRFVMEISREALVKMRTEKELVAVGVAGTITTLSAIDQNMEVYDSDKIHGSKLPVNRVKEILGRLKSLPLERRKEIKGLEPARADVIIAGALILLGILKGIGLSEVIVSECDILDGLILSLQVMSHESRVKFKKSFKLYY